MHHTTRYSGREYFAHRTASGDIGMSVNFVAPVYRRRHVVMSDEESAQRWLGKNGLPKGKAKELLDAALKNQGELADSNNLNRVCARGVPALSIASSPPL